MKLSDLERLQKLGEELTLWKAVRDAAKGGFTPRLSFDGMAGRPGAPMVRLEGFDAELLAEKYIAAARIKLSEMGVEE